MEFKNASRLFGRHIEAPSTTSSFQYLDLLKKIHLKRRQLKINCEDFFEISITHVYQHRVRVLQKIVTIYYLAIYE